MHLSRQCEDGMQTCLCMMYYHIIKHLSQMIPLSLRIIHCVITHLDDFLSVPHQTVKLFTQFNGVDATMSNISSSTMLLWAVSAVAQTAVAQTLESWRIVLAGLHTALEHNGFSLLFICHFAFKYKGKEGYALKGDSFGVQGIFI
jgi:hypothetical protein